MMAGVGSKPLIPFILGAWLAGTLFMWAVATQNFRVVERILAAPVPEVSARLSALPPGDARAVMRYQASEVNRLFFERWGWAQLALGLILTWLAFSSPADPQLRIASLILLAIAAILQLAIVPETIRLGRLLDFAPRSPAPPEAAAFWRLHTAYTALDSLKFLTGIYATVRAVRRRW
jgi:hypothetical protein